MDRARYAGPVGWFGADGDGEWGIALRSAQVDADDPRRVRLFAGCGIVAASDPAAELAESEAKLVPMRLRARPGRPAAADVPADGAVPGPKRTAGSRSGTVRGPGRTAVARLRGCEPRA